MSNGTSQPLSHIFSAALLYLSSFLLCEKVIDSLCTKSVYSYPQAPIPTWNTFNVLGFLIHKTEVSLESSSVVLPTKPLDVSWGLSVTKTLFFLNG